jgi:hypothetical protein
VSSFGLVMLYGGVGVWVLAGVSLLIFGGGKPLARSSGLKAEGSCP